MEYQASDFTFRETFVILTYYLEFLVVVHGRGTQEKPSDRVTNVA